MMRVAWSSFLASTLLIGCTEEPTDEPVVCELTGTSVYIGQTTGGIDTIGVGGSHALSFDNQSLNLWAEAGTIVDVGPVDCLEDIPAWPGGTAIEIAYQPFHGYSARYSDDTYLRFIAEEYDQGTLLVTYQYPY